MNAMHSAVDPIATLRDLTREQVEQRLAEIDAERAQLTTLKRSIIAREKCQRRHAPRIEAAAGSKGVRHVH